MEAPETLMQIATIGFHLFSSFRRDVLARSHVVCVCLYASIENKKENEKARKKGAERNQRVWMQLRIFLIITITIMQMVMMMR